MPQSLSAVYVHAIFSTRDRISFLEEGKVRKHVHAALAQISEDLGCPPVRVGGVSDHVHVLAHFGKGVGLSDWIKEMKRKSSLLVKDQYPTLMAFGWQAGYGLFSVDPRGLEGLGRYIDTQEIHHQKLSFQDEFRAILKENGVAFDERYLWS
jgi:REP element-mobilizing transposase RayT